MLQPVKFLPNTFVKEGRFPKFYTKNLTPGKHFFEQENWTAEEEHGKQVEYREADPKHSKLFAALARGGQQFGFKEKDVVLYLGASHGYTPSYVSDMIGDEGIMYCLDIAPRVVRDLVFVCEARKNMVPILADANNPASFAWRISAVDTIIMDIAQKRQLEIFLKNIDWFLKPGGYAMIAIKARSIDVTAKPFMIFKEIRRELEYTPGIVIVEYRELDPFEKDHAWFVVKKR